jgi:DNA replication protein DnaD
MNKASANFAYADGILNKWKLDNIKTVQEIEALEKNYYDNVKAAKQPAKGSPPKKKFQNYQGREWDHEKLAQMQREYLDKKLSQ